MTGHHYSPAKVRGTQKVDKLVKRRRQKKKKKSRERERKGEREGLHGGKEMIESFESKL